MYTRTEVTDFFETQEIASWVNENYRSCYDGDRCYSIVVVGGCHYEVFYNDSPDIPGYFVREVSKKEALERFESAQENEDVRVLRDPYVDEPERFRL